MSKKVGSRQTRGGRYFHAILEVFDQDRDKEGRSFRVQKINIEGLEQIAAVIVTAALVAGNFLLFTPWRDGNDPRQRHQENRLNQKKSNQHLADSKHPSLHHPKHEDQQAMEDTESIHRNIKKKRQSIKQHTKHQCANQTPRALMSSQSILSMGSDTTEGDRSTHETL